MLMQGHGAASQCPAPDHPLDLQSQILEAHRVVAVHHALELQREDQLQIFAAWASHKRAATLPSWNLKAAIELPQVVFPQKLIGGPSTVVIPAQAQLLRQTSLPGPEVALATTARLRRVSRDHLHPQL